MINGIIFFCKNVTKLCSKTHCLFFSSNFLSESGKNVLGGLSECHTGLRYCWDTGVITVHRQGILLLVVESGTRKFSCLSVECLSVESGTYDAICQFCTVKGMVAESEALKAQNCALSKLSLPMHSNG